MYPKISSSKSKHLAGFTLVELIVVITILVILGTVAFTSLGGYSSSARDSSRVSDLTNLKKGLDVFLVKSGIVPPPDANTMTITASGTPIGYQGYAGANMLGMIKMSNAQDPLDKKYYTYYTDTVYKRYQIMWLFENSTTGMAVSDVRYPSTQGNRLGIFLGNTGTTLNQPIQELYNPTSFTGVNVMTTSTGYTVLLSNTPGDQLTGSSAVVAQLTHILAPSMSYPFTKILGWINTSSIQGMTIDSNGYIYVVGNYYNNISNVSTITDFAGNILPGVSVGNSNDVFIAKLNSFGQQIWIKTMGGSGIDIGRGITTDINGNIYVVGSYTDNTGSTNGTKDFAGNMLPGVSWTNTADVFIVKLSGNDGSQLLVKTMGGKGADFWQNISLDSNNDIYIAWRYGNSSFDANSTKDFSGNPILGLCGVNTNDIFITKLSGNNGSQLWIKTMGGFGSDLPSNISIDSNNNIYMVGTYVDNTGSTNGMRDLAGNPLAGVSGINSTDGFAVKLSGNNGSQAWIKTIGGSGSDTLAGISIDTGGSVYVVWYYTNNTGNTNNTKDLAGNVLLGVSGTNSNDGYIAKLSGNDGSQIWTRTMGGNNTDSLSNISIDSNNNLYVVWSYINNITNSGSAIDLAGNLLLGVSGNNYIDWFISKLSGNDGLQTWIKTMGGEYGDTPSNISIDSNGSVYVAWNYTTYSVTHIIKDFIGNLLYWNGVVVTAIFLERL